MKILFIKPPNQHTPHVSPVLAFGYLSSVLKKQGHEVSVLNCVIDKLEYKEIEDCIREENPQIVGLQIFTCDFSSAKNVMQIAKKINSNITTIIGGPHSSDDYLEVLNDYPEADFGFRGEAEIGITGLFKHLESPESIKIEDIKGLIYRDNGDIRFNERGIVNDLDELGCPDWDIIDPRVYPKPQGTFTRCINTAPLISSRGCPYNCMYCSISLVMGKKLRKRSAAAVVDEMELLNKKYDVEEIQIWDDNFTLDRQRTMKICQMLIDRKLNIYWAVPNGVRLDSLDAELLKMMERSGCYSFSVGIESGSPRIVKLMNRDVSLNTIEEKVKLIKKESKIRVTGLFIMGFPTETLEDLQMTLDFSLKLPIDRAQFSDFTPHPGTKAFNMLLDSGEIKRSELNWDSYQLFKNNYHPKSMTNKQFRRFIAKTFMRFYLRPRILWGVLREINNKTQFIFALKRWLDIFH